MRTSISRAGGLLFLAILLIAPLAHAGGKIQISDTKWISLGVGARMSFGLIEDDSPDRDNWSNDFRLENMRIYLNGQIHKYLKFEINTECQDCPITGHAASAHPGGHPGSSAEMVVLDAIAKFEFNPYFNIWAGRLLVPLDRAELSGPFYQNTFDFDKTPFYPSDFGNPGAGVASAGRFGRDDGINIWGAFMDGKLSYVVGAFDGLDGVANQDDNLLYAGRVSFNFLNVEKNPGYYTSSTYYGNGGDILTVAWAFNYQNDGSGTAMNPGNFFGHSTDLLFEKVLPNKGVATVEGEYKVFDADLSGSIRNGTDATTCFCMFDGDSYSVAALYLFPDKIGIGQFQPYVRYTENMSDIVGDAEELEIGTNYVIDGHNARLSLMWQHGDIATKGRIAKFGQAGNGGVVDAIKLGIQFQL
ncbi:MAG: hypothetical protein GKS05_10910 [Nitrospirales bacterium]|nr:hypothetical protein [Nitrospirales bacterium]